MPLLLHPKQLLKTIVMVCGIHFGGVIIHNLSEVIMHSFVNNQPLVLNVNSGSHPAGHSAEGPGTLTGGHTSLPPHLPVGGKN